MSQALQNPIELLDLEELEVNIFRSVSPKEGRQRLHGGGRTGGVGGAGRVDSPDRGLMLNKSRRTDHGGTRLHVLESDHR